MQINHHVGRLVREVRYSVRGENETKIAYLRLAINDLKDGGATFIDYVAFNKTADNLRDLVTKVGQIVEVDFVMRNHNYTNNETGEKVYEMTNIINRFRVYGSKQTTETSNESTEIGVENPVDDGMDNEPDIPTFNDNDFDYMGG